MFLSCVTSPIPQDVLSDMHEFMSTIVVSKRPETGADGRGDDFIPCGIQPWKIPKVNVASVAVMLCPSFLRVSLMGSHTEK